MIDDYDLIKKMLLHEEGDKRYPYDCGSGQRIWANFGHPTIGIGHNLDARPLSDAVVALLLSEDWAITLEYCRELFPHYSNFSQARRLALFNMAFNLGPKKLAEFRDMVEAVNNGRWQEAAEEAKSSFWYHQVRRRAEKVCMMLKDDKIPEEYL